MAGARRAGARGGRWHPGLPAPRAGRGRPKARLRRPRGSLRQLPNAGTGALRRTSKGESWNRLSTHGGTVHPHLAQSLTTERIRGWQEEAAQARLAREARGARRARRGWRWGVWRTRVPATTGLAPPSTGPTPAAPSVTAQRGAVAGRLAGADERVPAGADERVPAAADRPVPAAADQRRFAAAGDRELAAADEHQPVTADVEQPAGADERQPAGPRAA